MSCPYAVSWTVTDRPSLSDLLRWMRPLRSRVLSTVETLAWETLVSRAS
jgi:hypothetical protein